MKNNINEEIIEALKEKTQVGQRIIKAIKSLGAQGILKNKKRVRDQIEP